MGICLDTMMRVCGKLSRRVERRRRRLGGLSIVKPKRPIFQPISRSSAPKARTDFLYLKDQGDPKKGEEEKEEDEDSPSGSASAEKDEEYNEDGVAFHVSFPLLLMVNSHLRFFAERSVRQG